MDGWVGGWEGEEIQMKIQKSTRLSKTWTDGYWVGEEITLCVSLFSKNNYMTCSTCPSRSYLTDTSEKNKILKILLNVS